MLRQLHTIHSGTRLSLLTATHSGIPTGLKRPLTQDFTLKTSTWIMELKCCSLNNEDQDCQVTNIKIHQSPSTTVLLILIPSQSTPSPDEDLALVVQREDNFIHCIGRYAANKCARISL